MRERLSVKEFFVKGGDEYYQAAISAVSLEDARAFATQSTLVRDDCRNGHPNTSLPSTTAALGSAEAFLIPRERLFFNNIREVSRLYRQLFR